MSVADRPSLSRRAAGRGSPATFAGTGRKAIALGLDATGATVADDNTLGPVYGRLVDFDHDSARTGYTGPQA